MVRLLLIPSRMDWHFPAAPSFPTPGAQPSHCRFNEGRAERPDPPSGRARSEPPSAPPRPRPEPHNLTRRLCFGSSAIGGGSPSSWGGGACPARVRLVARNYGAALQCVSGVVVLTAQTCRGCRLPSFDNPVRFVLVDFKSHKAQNLTDSIAVYKLNRNRLCEFGLYLFFSRQVIVRAPWLSKKLLSDVKRFFA